MDLDLHTPPGAVSPHGHAQIAARLDIWAAALAASKLHATAFLSYCFTPVHIQDSP
jgi:hypothetical protein